MNRRKFKSSLSRIGISRADAARLLGVHRSTVSRWINGHRKPRKNFLEKIEIIQNYAKRLKIHGRFADEKLIKHRLEVLEKPLRKRTDEGELDEGELMSITDLGSLIRENLANIRKLIINGEEVHDSAFAWWTDEVNRRRDKAEEEGDTSNYWRITLDYRVSFEDGILSITILI